MRFDDPHFEPPVNIRGPDVRAYVEKVVELLRDAALPSSDPIFHLESIEMRGERPDTQIVFRYTGARDAGQRAVGVALWRREYPTSGADETLHEAASVAGWIYSDWLAGDLDPLEIDEQPQRPP
jgi:hypothetical protein